VVRTLVGYAGGARKNPTYQSLGDHTETVQVVFDPTRVSYEQLLGVFWSSHDPSERTWSRQYKTMVLTHGDEQRRLAEKTRDEVAAKLRVTVRTEILPAGEFYPAEDYHQKYYLRSRPRLLEELEAAYPDAKALAASTAAARVNGYLGGNGTLENYKADAPRLGLSKAALDELEEILAGKSR
jgi:peptide-methionine (S)-S-oxide reductase